MPDKTEFTHIFNSPYDTGDARNGKRCAITGSREVPSIVDQHATDTMYLIVFEDGETMGVWSDEVDEVKES